MGHPRYMHYTVKGSSAMGLVNSLSRSKPRFEMWYKMQILFKFNRADLESLFQTTDNKVIRKDNNFYAVSMESLQPKFTILKD